MQKIAISCALLATIATTSASLFENCDNLFTTFKQRYGMKYSSTEEAKRGAVFCQNMKKADSLNELNGAPAFGVSKFADRTEDEGILIFLF